MQALKTKVFAVCVIVAGCSVLGAGIWGLERRAARTRAQIQALEGQAGRPFPPVSFAGADGGRVMREQLLDGRATVLLFFSPSCEICQRELTALASAAPGFGAGVKTVVVSVAGERQTASFSRSAVWPFTVLWDRDRVFAGVFNGAMVPVAMIIDPRGTIAAVHIGGQQRADLIALVQSAVPGTAPWLAREGTR